MFIFWEISAKKIRCSVLGSCDYVLGVLGKKMKCSFFCLWEFSLQHILHSSLFWMHLVRQYTDFLDFAYPELAACSKPHYTAVEGYDRHLKVFVPFFATVYNTVYGLLVEVLEKDASRFHSCMLHKFNLPDTSSHLLNFLMSKNSSWNVNTNACKLVVSLTHLNRQASHRDQYPPSFGWDYNRF